MCPRIDRIKRRLERRVPVDAEFASTSTACPDPLHDPSERSLSVIAIFCVSVVPNETPEDGPLIVNVAVSGPSKNTSSTTVNVTEPVICPPSILIWIPAAASPSVSV